MSAPTNFSTESTKHGWAVEANVELPASLADEELIAKRYGTPERMIAVANKGWVIACQSNMRKRQTADEALSYAEGFCNDGRKDTYVPTISTDEAKDQGFSAEQMEYLRRKGMKIS